MFDWLRKRLAKVGSSLNKKHSEHVSEFTTLSGDPKRDNETVRKVLKNPGDLVGKDFIINMGDGIKSAFSYIDGLADKNVVDNHILRPLLLDSTVILKDRKPVTTGEKALEWAEKRVLTTCAVTRTHTFEEIFDAILTGDTVVFFEDSKEALLVSSKGWAARSPEEPSSELVLKGPRDGFVENLRTNTALLRRRFPVPDLIIEQRKIGRRSRTQVALVYLDDIVNRNVLDELHKRLDRIDIDVVLAAGKIEQYIEDNPFSPFPSMRYTERPDVASALIAEGKVAIITDGTPVVSLAPMLFLSTFQSPDDYNLRPYYSTIVRWFRYAAFFISTSLPGIYIALVSFHQELLPTSLALTLASALEGTPFPVTAEVVIMGFIFELLREAGIRLPRNIGTTISIVGALVLGQSAVQSGLVSTPTVVIIALTAICSFMVPVLTDVSSLLRIFITIACAVYGAYGLLLASSLILLHMCSLRSFGIPYLAPIAPLIPQDLKDTLVRAPMWLLNTRSKSLEPQQLQRQAKDLRPHPPEGDGK